ncbi:hypothetical protein NDU88_002333 [Pleurodeles waltl]|uniref:Uncharacterized protein n=1 Tax=Pleurodeles waltl TaxID=8319 RepID=A0AAV7VCJ7_PLEWA|nr:hypothetical protein NDU88_002333 [Pleurodeles waltl]
MPGFARPARSATRKRQALEPAGTLPKADFRAHHRKRTSHGKSRVHRRNRQARTCATPQINPASQVAAALRLVDRPVELGRPLAPFSCNTDWPD